MKKLLILSLALILSLSLAACGDNSGNTSGGGLGDITVGGSSAGSTPEADGSDSDPTESVDEYEEFDEIYSVNETINYISMDILPFREGYAQFCGRMFDYDGKIVKVFDESFIGSYFSEGLMAFETRTESADGRTVSKFGYCDKNFKTVIQPVYDSAEAFSEGLALVSRQMENGRRCYGYIDKTGKEVIPLIHGPGSRFKEGLAALNFYRSTDDKVGFGFIDKTGALVIHDDEPSLYLLLGYNDFSEGLARVSISGYSAYSYIGKSGTKVMPYYTYSAAGDFSEGLANVRGRGDYGAELDWGYIDKAGNTVIGMTYADAKPFSEGLAAVKLKEESEKKYGFIDKTGKMVIEPTEIYNSTAYDDNWLFHEGLFFVENGWLDAYYIDKTGKKVIDEKAGGLTIFSEGHALAANQNGKIYVIKNPLK